MRTDKEYYVQSAKKEEIKTPRSFLSGLFALKSCVHCGMVRDGGNRHEFRYISDGSGGIECYNAGCNPPSPKTVPCEHCIVGNAELTHRNGNLELYKCPQCNGFTKVTYTEPETWVAVGFMF